MGEIIGFNELPTSSGDKEEKTFYVKGTGSAYSKAWGGRKDYVYPNLSNYQGQVFKVHLTESVGNEIWYRGVLGGKTVWIHSNHVFQIEESRTSRLGHIRSSEVTIYKDLSLTSSFKAGSTYTHHVYYIKRQALINGDTYYLISKQPSSVRGTVGWVKSSDLTSYPHLVVDKEEKTFYVKGTGSAYSKAWGGRKDYVYPNLSNYQGQVFKVHLTESVGNEIWYRGVLGGKTVWIHSNHVFQIEESRTSRLGHIRSSEVTIYKDLSLTSSFKAGSTYTHHVYYIKRQALINGDTYYLISKQPSSVRGTVGWVKSSDLTSYRHLVVDKEEKTFYVKGTGSAYSKAWGGRKDYVYPNLSNYKGQVFKVHLTESVGNEIWYRGILGGKTVWIHPSHLSETPLTTIITNYTGYNLTLNRMLDIQMSVNPQTDKRYKLWIREDAFKAGSIRNGNGVVEGDNWNLRRGPGTSYLSGGKVNNGTILTLYSSTRGTDGYIWYHVLYTSGWVIPDRSDVLYYLNPTHFTSFRDSLQFAKLSSSANLQRDEVNGKILKGKGILDGKAQAFIDAGKTHGVNEIYLISHALLETGNGSSTLATGVTYKGKVVYNMYGIGAYDGCAVECGAKYAYEAGWFTPEDAIIGGAAFVGKNYIQKGQDTLYKMRWNPEFASKNNYATHQYATDIGWALKQTARMNNLYNLLDSYTITLDIPKYQ